VGTGQFVVVGQQAPVQQLRAAERAALSPCHLGEVQASPGCGGGFAKNLARRECDVQDAAVSPPPPQM
jgi:hypothetical protein